MSTTTHSTCDDKSKISNFWAEFFQAESSLRDLSAREKVVALNDVFEKYYSEIVLEMYAPVDGIESVCFSAHGKEEHFPLIMELVKLAPPSDRYKFVALRPRSQSPNFAIGMSEDFKLNTSDILVAHYADGEQVGLEIRFGCEIPSDFEKHARNMAFIMLDHVIGEYDFSVKVGAVDFVDSWSDAAISSAPLSEFPPVFDSFWKNDLGHTGIFPLGEHMFAGLTVAYGADGEPEETAVVTINESAKSVAMRADLSQAMTLIMPASDEDKLEYAQNKEEQIGHLLEQSRSGIFAFSMLKSLQRHTIFYVSDVASARALVEKIIPAGMFELHDEYDFRWSKYCEFANALASTR